MRKLHFTIPLLLCLVAAAPVTHVDHPGLVKLHWQQAGDANTFREMTTFEMIDLLHEMDVHHISLAPGQSLSPEKKDSKIGPDMSAADIDALLAKLKSVRMDVVCYGVTDFGTTPDDAKKMFEFGKKLKLKTFVSDASPESLEMLDKLAVEYQISVAITSDSPAKRYVTCDAAMEAIKGRSKRIGICADIQPWSKSGQKPLECVKKLASHILVVNLSDAGDESLDVKDCLGALKDAGFKAICRVEDRSPGAAERLEGFAKSINAFNEIVTEIAK